MDTPHSALLKSEQFQNLNLLYFKINPNSLTYLLTQLWFASPKLFH